MNPATISRKINDCTNRLSAEKSIGEQYRLCSQMADYTRHLVLENKTEPLKSSFKAVVQLYKTGSQSCRRAIENVYLYSVGSAILHCTHGKEMMRTLPNLFRRLIIGQIVYSGL